MIGHSEVNTTVLDIDMEIIKSDNYREMSEVNRDINGMCQI